MTRPSDVRLRLSLGAARVLAEVDLLEGWVNADLLLEEYAPPARASALSRRSRR